MLRNLVLCAFYLASLSELGCQHNALYMRVQRHEYWAPSACVKA